VSCLRTYTPAERFAPWSRRLGIVVTRGKSAKIAPALILCLRQRAGAGHQTLIDVSAPAVAFVAFSFSKPVLRQRRYK
jgi:hypothetical protein